MKRKLAVRGVRSVFRLATSSDVADDGDAANNRALLVGYGQISALKNTGSRRSIVVRFRNRLRTGERSRQTTAGTARFEKRKNLVCSAANHVFAGESGDALHRAIPRNDAAVAIEREETVDAGVEQAL
jgi:hypothetical protein